MYRVCLLVVLSVVGLLTPEHRVDGEPLVRFVKSQWHGKIHEVCIERQVELYNAKGRRYLKSGNADSYAAKMCHVLRFRNVPNMKAVNNEVKKLAASTNPVENQVATDYQAGAWNEWHKYYELPATRNLVNERLKSGK